MHLLTKAGIKVTPVLSNTTDHYSIDKNIHEVRQFKTVLVMLETERGKIILDAADTESNFNSLAKKYIKAEKFVVSKEDYGWIDIKY